MRSALLIVTVASLADHKTPFAKFHIGAGNLISPLQLRSDSLLVWLEFELVQPSFHSFRSSSPTFRAVPPKRNAGIERIACLKPNGAALNVSDQNMRGRNLRLRPDPLGRLLTERFCPFVQYIEVSAVCKKTPTLLSGDLPRIPCRFA